MKETKRIERINENLNKHFRSNNDAWWVSNGIYVRGHIDLHRGIGGDRIKPIWVAFYILRTEKSVDQISCLWNNMVYTRTSLRMAGYKV